MCTGAEPEAAKGAEEVAGSAKGAESVAGASDAGAKNSGDILSAMSATQASDDAAFGANALGTTGDLAAEGVLTAPTVGAATSGGAAAADGAAAGVTAKDVLSTAKDVAPLVAAGASALGAEAGVAAAKKASSSVASVTPATPAPLPQAAVDPDLSLIRKKNALLFGLDSPASTDLTAGKADYGSLGRVSILGGTSKLGA